SALIAALPAPSGLLNADFSRSLPFPFPPARVRCAAPVAGPIRDRRNWRTGAKCGPSSTVARQFTSVMRQLDEFSIFARPPHRGAQAPRQDKLALFSHKLPCDTLHRASPDPKGLGYPQHPHALCKLLSHLAFGLAVYLRPTEFHTLCDGVLVARFYSLSDHRPLEPSNRAGSLENELAHRGRRVDRLLVQVQVHPAGFEVLDRVEQVAQRAAQAVNRPSHDDIESPAAGVL